MGTRLAEKLLYYFRRLFIEFLIFICFKCHIKLFNYSKLQFMHHVLCYFFHNLPLAMPKFPIEGYK